MSKTTQCQWTRPRVMPDGSLESVQCRVMLVNHTGEHDFPSEYDYTDSKGNPAAHPDCRFEPFKWLKSGKKWGFDGPVLVCHEHKRPAPCLGHPDFDVYALEAEEADRKFRERGL